MYPAKDARELAILLRISRDLDIVGDVTTTVDNPSELLAWALVLANPEILAWRADHSGHRYLHVTARRNRAPVRGWVTAVLPCDQHEAFWDTLGLDELAAGDRRSLGAADLSSAWAVMPVTPASTSSSSQEAEGPHPPTITESA